MRETKKVLIVDGEEKLFCDLFKDYIRSFCKKFEIEFLAIGSGTDDLRGIGELSPDLIIFSINAAEDSAKVLHNVKEKIGDDGISTEIPFLMITEDIKETREIIGSVGRSHILVKPAKPDILACVVREILGRT